MAFVTDEDTRIGHVSLPVCAPRSHACAMESGGESAEGGGVVVVRHNPGVGGENFLASVARNRFGQAPHLPTFGRPIPVHPPDQSGNKPHSKGFSLRISMVGLPFTGSLKHSAK